MGDRPRLMSFMLAGALLAACTSQGARSTLAQPTPTEPPTASPCVIALTHLGAFTERLAGDLAALRPLVIAKSFNAIETATAARQVSATVTAYNGLELAVGACPATAGLSQRVAALLNNTTAILGKSLDTGMRDDRVERDAAASLLGLLPEVVALSTAAKGIADGIGIDVKVAQVPAGATKPVGSLPPLKTPTPSSAPTARATSGPAVGGGGSNGTGWDQNAYNTAMAYQASASQTYGADVPNEIANLMSWNDSYSPDDTPEMRMAARHEGDVYVNLVRNSINGHLAFMASHPAASCFLDAYTADRSLASAYLGLITLGGFPESGPTLLMTERKLAEVEAQAQAFSSRFSSYFSDCH